MIRSLKFLHPNAALLVHGGKKRCDLLQARAEEPSEREVDFPDRVIEAILESDEAASFRRAKVNYGLEWNAQRFIHPDVAPRQE